ncbi:MAG TPA: SDR family oxidoreductase [Stellaceae bacterium]|nr:SDR family oxidoreductase [Stellaceae bacterium]
MGRLEGKSAFITGAGGGIGGAIARRFAAEGAAIACADLDGGAADRTAAAISKSGGRAIALACDVADARQVAAAIERAVTAFSLLNVVVNTAADDDPMGDTVELNEEDWNHALAVNLTGVFLVAKYGIPKLRQAGGGSIVIVASQLGQVAVPRRPAYVTSKAALIQLARSMAVDHAKENIRVNTLSPGAIETNRLLKRLKTIEAVRAALVPLHPIGRLGQPEEIANGALFLASDEASFMTGADLVIDGGYTCV